MPTYLYYNQRRKILHSSTFQNMSIECIFVSNINLSGSWDNTEASFSYQVEVELCITKFVFIQKYGTLICQHLITLITLPTSVSFCQMYRCWQIYCRIANIYTYHLYLLLSDPTLYIKCNSISKLLTEV